LLEFVSTFTGHHHRETTDHSSVKPIPFRGPTTSRLSGLSPGSDFPEIPDLCNSIPWASAMLKRTVPCPLRLRSQVFSTSQRFLQSQASRPCFMSHAVREISLQSFPLTRIAHPSRGRLLPCSYPPACLNARPDVLSSPVSADSHAFTRLPGSPRRL